MAQFTWQISSKQDLKAWASHHCGGYIADDVMDLNEALDQLAADIWDLAHSTHFAPRATGEDWGDWLDDAITSDWLDTWLEQYEKRVS